jgi:CDP-glycerol glycerophosphotransferase (TagB/SpsB family)
LVTDYSTLAFDYLFFDRPIVYFVPDFAAYSSRTGLYFTPEEAMPGQLAATPQALFAAVGDALAGTDSYSQMRAMVRRNLLGDYQGGAAARIFERLAGSGELPQ